MNVYLVVYREYNGNDDQFWVLAASPFTTELSASAYKDQQDKISAWPEYHIIPVVLDDPDDYDRKIEALEAEIQQREKEKREQEWAARQVRMTPDEKAREDAVIRRLDQALLVTGNVITEIHEEAAKGAK